MSHRMPDNPFPLCPQNSSYTPSSTGCTEIFDDLQFDSPYATTDTPPSHDSTALSTPDYSGYTFGQVVSTPLTLSSGPPTPEMGGTCAYSGLQQYQTYPESQSQNQPLPIRSSTDTDNLCQPLHTYVRGHSNQPFHRRSLSAGDEDQNLAAAVPQFVRLQGTRQYDLVARQLMREDAQRDATLIGSYRRNQNTRENPPTSAPVETYSAARSVQQQAYDTKAVAQNTFPQGEVDMPDTEIVAGKRMRVQLTGPAFIHMSHEEQLRESARIIEVGAMAVVNARSNSSSKVAYQEDRGVSGDNMDVLEMVNMVETHLKHELGETTNGLKGCAMIRQALAQKTENARILGKVKGEHIESTTPRGATKTGEGKDEIVSAGDEFAEPEVHIYLGHRVDLYEILKRDLQANGFGMDEY